MRYPDITELCECGRWRAAPEQIAEMVKDNAVAGNERQTAWGKKSRTGCLGVVVVVFLMTLGWILVTD